MCKLCNGHGHKITVNCDREYIVEKSKKQEIFEEIAKVRDKFIRRNRYYYEELKYFYCYHIPPGHRVLELGCGNGDLLAAVQPCQGVGVEFCETVVSDARKKHPKLEFILSDIEELPNLDKFDYIIISDVLENVTDIQNLLTQLKTCCSSHTRIICNFFNHLWEPLLRFGQKVGLNTPNPISNWLSIHDIENFFYLSDFETISSGLRMLFPRNIPVLASFFNKIIARLPFISRLCLTQYVIMRLKPNNQHFQNNFPSVSVIIPTRDEAGNIQGCFERTPKLGKWTELIFVDGNSTDGTIEAIEDGILKYKNQWENITLIHQDDGTGKGDAVRKGFAKAKGDILMILDSDLTMPPEDLPKYYEAIISGKGEFINGCRLIYPMEKLAMRTINYIGNKVFSAIFTWLLKQNVRDTLCGTKVLWRNDYEKIAANRHYFGDFDPFGDFDLLFGAAKLDLKIVDLPIRYRERNYGDIKIERWKHALLLFRMCIVGLQRMK